MSTVYKSASRRRYKGKHRASRKRNFLYVSLGTLLAAAFTVGCGVGFDSSDAQPLDDSPAAASPAAKVNGFTDGQYRVGSDIKPGTYTTTVRAESRGCYWARLKAFDGDVRSITENKILGGGAHGRMTVKASDVGVEFHGGCVWTKAAK